MVAIWQDIAFVASGPMRPCWPGKLETSKQSGGKRTQKKKDNVRHLYFVQNTKIQQKVKIEYELYHLKNYFCEFLQKTLFES